MDESLKARLIGASILVVLAVVLVPELLSGRKQAATVAAGENARATRSYTIDLGGAVAAGSRLPAEPSAPAPATSGTLPSIDKAPAPAATLAACLRPESNSGTRTTASTTRMLAPISRALRVWSIGREL
jgi:cell division septation protein DedD